MCQPEPSSQVASESAPRSTNLESAATCGGDVLFSKRGRQREAKVRKERKKERKKEREKGQKGWAAEEESLSLSLSGEGDSGEEKSSLSSSLVLPSRPGAHASLNPLFLLRGSTNLLELSAELLGDDGADVGEDLFSVFGFLEKSLT